MSIEFPVFRLLAAAVFATMSAVTLAADVEYAYDEAGRLVGVVDPNGDAAQYVYDPAGNIIEIKRFASTVLSLMEFQPKEGPIGTAVTIWGSGFSTTPGNNAVTFNGTAATVTSATKNKLVVAVPSGATTGNLSVTVAGTSVNSSKVFTVVSTVNCATRLTGVTPSVATAGTTFSVAGSAFDRGANIASVNAYPAAVQSATGSNLTATVPAGATSGRVMVSTSPLCRATGAGDIFIPPSPYTATDIGATGRLTLNGAAVGVTLAANKKGQLVFDGTPRDGAAVYATSSTLGSFWLEIHSPDGTVLASSYITSATGSVGPVQLPATGGYTVWVNPYTTTGGNVTLQLGGPDLVVTAASVGTITANQNGSFNIPTSFTVANNGIVAAGPSWTDYVYAASQVVLPMGASIVGSTNRSTSLNPGSSYTVNQTYVATVASGFSPGNRTLFVKADSYGMSAADSVAWIKETNENNNIASVSITLPTYPDLAVSNASVGSIVVNQNGSYSIPVSFTVSNLGTNPAIATWNDQGYLSASGVLDAASTWLGVSVRNTALAGGASYNVAQTYTISGVAAGNYTVFLKADGSFAPNQANSGVVYESSEANNAVGVSVTLPTRPDLVISNPSVGTITKNSNTWNIPVTFTVTNSGGSPALPAWYDVGYLSTNGALDTSSVATNTHYRSTALAVGASYTVTHTFVTTAVAPGNYTLFVKTDGHLPTGNGYLAESNETNNATAGLAVTLN